MAGLSLSLEEARQEAQVRLGLCSPLMRERAAGLLLHEPYSPLCPFKSRAQSDWRPGGSEPIRIIRSANNVRVKCGKGSVGEVLITDTTSPLLCEK